MKIGQDADPSCNGTRVPTARVALPAPRCALSVTVGSAAINIAGDPSTLGNQIAKLKQRFGLKRVVLVGDRGMITQARIEGDLKPAGLDWITALRAPSIQQLAAEGGSLQLSLFDERDLAEIESPEFPGARLVVCKNPALPKNASANATSCSMRPSKTSRTFRRASYESDSPCLGPTRSASPSGHYWGAARSPSTSASPLRIMR